MFRTVRGFLALAPALFAVTLVAYLSSKPHAAETFVLYPIVASALESRIPQGPVVRFSIVATFAFLGPYLAAGLLLLLSDAGVSAAAALWRSPRKGAPEPPLTGGRSPAAPPRHAMPPESLWALLIVATAAAVTGGFLLKHVAGGGELPGGVNVAPAFVAAVPFAAVATGFAAALLASIPRTVHRVLTRRAPPPPEPIISG